MGGVGKERREGRRKEEEEEGRIKTRRSVIIFSCIYS